MAEVKLFSPCALLPGEVWTLVFRYLSLSDRLRVRATCKYFMELVDSALWRKRTVELGEREVQYEEDFWRTLRRWRVTSARLSYHHSCSHIAKELPGLTTLITEIAYFTEMQDFKCFTNLERLYLGRDCSVGLEELANSIPHCLTHLIVHYSYDYTASLPSEIPPDSPFKNLKCLVLRCTFDTHPVNVLHFFLSSLPQLQHFAPMFDFSRNTSFEGHISDLPPLNNCSLSSLDLSGCDTNMLPMDFMKMISFLRNLAISFPYFYHDDDETDEDDESEKLSAWLRDLPGLTSLMVMHSETAGFPVRSIPSSVTRLILTLFHITSEEMTALSAQLPNLRSLKLRFLQSGIVPAMALIPRLFPRLKTLRLFFDQVPEEAILSLASLKELEVLETLDDEPLPAALVCKLRELTNNRVRVYKQPEGLWIRSCDCWSDIPMQYLA